jgi:Cof subfamily protein (haloacid dehalogenase superfamily)
MVYRLVALDVDGTVLAGDHTLHAPVTEAIRAAQARGARVCLATGKLFVSLGDLVRAFDLRGPQITCNGAAICDAPGGRIIASFPLRPAEVTQSRAALAAYAGDLPLAWYTTDAIYTTAPPGEMDAVLARYHEPPLRHVASFDAGLPPPVKLLVAAPPDRLDALRAQMEPRLAGRVRLVRTAVDFLECMRLDTTKGTALETIMQTLNIARAETLAIGDSENDIPLIQAAGLGIAMGNAIPALRAAAQAITRTNDDDGVAHALKDWVLG